jgi:hypothetical protein
MRASLGNSSHATQSGTPPIINFVSSPHHAHFATNYPRLDGLALKQLVGSLRSLVPRARPHQYLCEYRDEHDSRSSFQARTQYFVHALSSSNELSAESSKWLTLG